jgi:hypothetical protein
MSSVLDLFNEFEISSNSRVHIFKIQNISQITDMF